MKKINLYLFDIDGTILLGDQLIEGAKETIAKLRTAGKKVAFFTNNSSRSASDYAEKLRGFGIEVEEEEIVSAGIVLVDYMAENHPGSSIYLLGTKRFKEMFEAKNIKVVDEVKDYRDHQVDYVIVALDTELNYKKIETACKLLSTDVGYLAANEDLVFPIENGISLPDCKAICNMLETATKRVPEYFGKPNHIILDYALKKFKANKSETMIVGDRLYTDIACGNKNGCATTLVLTGEAKKEDVEKSSYKPTYIVESIKKLSI